MPLWTFVLAFVAFQIQVSSIRVHVDEAIARRNKVVLRDAIELCGEADLDTLLVLDKPCTSNNTTKEGESLQAIFTSRGQPDKYRLPPYRLYVCHPNAEKKAILFSARGMETITSDEEMQLVVKLLFENTLWTLKSSVNETLYRYYKQISGMIKGREKRDLNSIYLWVLDRDGNIVFAPEVQSGTVFKHGDLTPGQTPWDRPAEGVKPVQEEAACCCSSSSDITSAETCKYTLIEHGENNVKLCCKWRLHGCSSTSAFSQKLDEPSCRMPTPDNAEKHVAGDYRGITRAGGEMRFPDGKPPLVQDKSAYSLARLSIHGSDRNAGNIKNSLKNGQVAPSIGTCAMGVLKTYWRDLGLPVDTVTFAAAEFDAKGNERLTPV